MVIPRPGHNRRMSSLRLVATGLVLFAAMIASSASAQDCNDLYPWTCPGYVGPPHQSIRPGVPFPPIDIAPNLQPSEQAPAQPDEMAVTVDPALRRQYAAHYAAIRGERFLIPAVRLSDINPEFLRKAVIFHTREQPGTIVIDPQNHFLYLVQGGGRALRYGVGVGRQGFGWSGAAIIHDKQEWPDWYPPREMIQRQPDLRRQMSELQGGLGMPGGPRNPLGSRAMYLWQGNKDTLYRIHGTVEPWTIGTSVSSGCIRMINQDAIDLYQRTLVGARVVVLPRH
jgi:lipoprotein-anchoring transpeptidase ErfK/SrfK